jgi:hypothetical protein
MVELSDRPKKGLSSTSDQNANVDMAFEAQRILYGGLQRSASGDFGKA